MILAAVALAVALGAIALSLFLYVRRLDVVDRLAKTLAPLYSASFHKYWVDEAYSYFPVGFTIGLAKLAQASDANVVDGAVNGVGWMTRLSSRLSGLFDFRVVDGIVNLVALLSYYASLVIRSFQTGQFQNYAFAILVGVIVLVVGYEWDAVAALIAHLTGGGR